MEHLFLVVLGLDGRDAVLIGMQHFQHPGHFLRAAALNVFQVRFLVLEKGDLAVALSLPLQLLGRAFQPAAEEAALPERHEIRILQMDIHNGLLCFRFYVGFIDRLGEFFMKMS